MEECESGHINYLSQSLLESSPLGSNSQCTKEGNSCFFKTLFNGLNALSGIGILSIAYALASSGWLSLVLLFAVAIATCYSGLLIKRCMDMDSTIRTYPDMGERAFGNIGKTAASVVMNSELFLAVTGYLISEGDNLHKLFPEVEFQACGIQIGGRASFIIIVALIVLPSVWLDDLSILSYISAIGVVASLVILVSILWVGAFDGVGFHHKGELINWSGIPTSASLFGFCYCAHPVFPTLYHSMKKKHNFSRVLLLCFLIATICYASMAIFGYLMFGSAVKSQITLNLPIHKLSSKVAIYTTLVNPLSKYALMLEPVARAAESWFPNYHKKRPVRILIRTAMVATQVLVALEFPFFGYLMSLVGAFLSITASVILPCLFYLKISGTSFGVELMPIAGTLVLGVLIAVFGTYTSLIQLLFGTIVDE